MPAIALDTKGTNTATGLAVALTLVVTAGDLIVVGVSNGSSVMFGGPGTITVNDTANAGNYPTAIAPHNNAALTQQVGVFYFANSAGGTITITAHSTVSQDFSICASCYKNANTSVSSVLGPNNQADGTTGTSADSGAIVPLQNGALIYCCISDNDAGGFTNGSGFAKLSTDATVSFGDEFQVQTTAASIHGTFTGASEPWTIQAVAFYPPASGGSGGSNNNAGLLRLLGVN